MDNTEDIVERLEDVPTHVAAESASSDGVVGERGGCSDNDASGMPGEVEGSGAAIDKGGRGEDEVPAADSKG